MSLVTHNDKQMEVLQFLNVSWVRFIMHIEMDSFYCWNTEITFSTNTHYHRLSILLLTFFLVLVALCFIGLFFLICQLHNIAEQFLKNSCCICCIGLMEYLEVVAHENSLSLRTSWTNVIWNGFAEIHQICKKCIYFTNINLISSGLCNIYSTHYFMAGFLNYISLNSSICRKLFDVWRKAFCSAFIIQHNI